MPFWGASGQCSSSNRRYGAEIALHSFGWKSSSLLHISRRFHSTIHNAAAAMNLDNAPRRRLPACEGFFRPNSVMGPIKSSPTLLRLQTPKQRVKETLSLVLNTCRWSYYFLVALIFPRSISSLFPPRFRSDSRLKDVHMTSQSRSDR